MSNYRRGADFERTVRDDLQENGYTVVRSAGSKTKVDLIAIKQGEILFVQCKLANSRMPNADWNELLRLALMIRAQAVVAVKVTGRIAPDYQRILGNLLLGEQRTAGTHYEPWSPDPVGEQ